MHVSLSTYQHSVGVLKEQGFARFFGRVRMRR
jgi:hypothetical protein